MGSGSIRVMSLPANSDERRVLTATPLYICSAESNRRELLRKVYQAQAG